MKFVYLIMKSVFSLGLFIILFIFINYSSLYSRNIFTNNPNSFVKHFINFSIGTQYHRLVGNEDFNLILENNGYSRVGNISLFGFTFDGKYFNKELPITYSLSIAYAPRMFSITSTNLDDETTMFYSGGGLNMNIGYNKFIILGKPVEFMNIERALIINPEVGLSYNMLTMEADSTYGHHVFGLDHSAFCYNIGIQFDFYQVVASNGFDIFLKIGHVFEFSHTKTLRFSGNYFQNPGDIDIDQSGFYVKLGIGKVTLL